VWCSDLRLCILGRLPQGVLGVGRCSGVSERHQDVRLLHHLSGQTYHRSAAVHCRCLRHLGILQTTPIISLLLYAKHISFCTCNATQRTQRNRRTTAFVPEFWPLRPLRLLHTFSCVLCVHCVRCFRCLLIYLRVACVELDGWKPRLTSKVVLTFALICIVVCIILTIYKVNYDKMKLEAHINSNSGNRSPATNRKIIYILWLSLNNWNAYAHIYGIVVVLLRLFSAFVEERRHVLLHSTSGYLDVVGTGYRSLLSLCLRGTLLFADDYVCLSFSSQLSTLLTIWRQMNAAIRKSFFSQTCLKPTARDYINKPLSFAVGSAHYMIICF